MGNLGEMLKAAREAKGVSLLEAEAETKIRKRYLEALENEEFHIIPGVVYARGFLKTYAGYLGLDQKEVITVFRMLNTAEENEQPRRTTVNQVKYKSYSSPRRRKKLKWKPSLLTVVLAAAAVVTLLLFDNLWNNDGGSAINPPKNTQDAISKSEPVTAPKETGKPPGTNGQSSVPATVYGSGYGQVRNPLPAPNPAAGQQVNLVLTTKEQESWIRVVADGVQKYSGIMGPGQVQNFNAKDKIYVKLGNAGAVEVNYNGQNLGVLGPPGKVKEREFGRVSASVYASPY